MAATPTRPDNQIVNPLKVFAGSGNPLLAAKVAEELGLPSVSACRCARFNDGEVDIQILENVRMCDVYVVSSTCKPVNDNLMELFFLIRTLKRASARYITAVIPYYGYARGDKKDKPRVPIPSSDVALLLEAAGVDRVIVVDIHSIQSVGFFRNIPVDNLYSSELLVQHVVSVNLEKAVVVSPDAGGVKRAKYFMNRLKDNGVEPCFAIIVKERKKAGEVASTTLIGADVIPGSDCIVVDDLGDTMGTMLAAVKELKVAGARRVFAVLAHGVFSKDALQRIEACEELNGLWVTDTIPHASVPSKVTVVSVAPLLAQAIRRTHEGESVSALFHE